jgi:hypothetical protein
MPAAVHLQLRIVGDDGTVFTDKEILCLGKSSERLEAFGLSFREGKALQERLQRHVVTARAAAQVNQHRRCPACGGRLRSKGQYPIVFRRRSATSPSSVRIFTAVAAERRTAEPSAPWPGCSPNTPRLSCCT